MIGCPFLDKDTDCYEGCRAARTWGAWRICAESEVDPMYIKREHSLLQQGIDKERGIKCLRK